MSKLSVSLWMRSPPDVSVFLLARTQGGEPLRVPINVATLEHQSIGDWRPIVIPLRAQSSEYGKNKKQIKGRIAEIGFLVEARFAQATQGTVGIDEVRLLENTDETFHLDNTAPLAPGLPGSSQLMDRLAVNIHLLHAPHALDLARDTGFRFVRMDLLWSKVERRGRYRFFAYDALMRELEARGMGALWILDYGHPQHGGDRPQTNEDIAAFARYSAAVAAHFKGRDVRYEIWNEPNNEQFWKPTPNPTEYGVLLREAIAAIHREDPSARVSVGGVAKMDLAFLGQVLASGAARGANAIGVHPYRANGPETVVPEFLTLRTLVSKELGENVEIWNTEWGYSSYDYPLRDVLGDGHSDASRKRQAVMAVREALTVWALNLPVAVWYDLHDDGTDPTNPEHNYGLLDSDNDDKPAMRALRTLTQAARTRKYIGLIRDLPDGVHAMRFDGAGDTVLVLWREYGHIVVQFSKQNFISATNIFDEPMKLKSLNGGAAALTLDESHGPVYLHLKHLH
jgi:hypothetical protein